MVCVLIKVASVNYGTKHLLCRPQCQIPVAMLDHTQCFAHMLLYISHCLPAMLAYTTSIEEGLQILEA